MMTGLARWAVLLVQEFHVQKSKFETNPKCTRKASARLGSALRISSGFRARFRSRILKAVLKSAVLVDVSAIAAQGPNPESWPGASLFNGFAVHRLEITISAQNAESLRRAPRTFVPATLSEEGHVYSEVALRLKGAVGSFRPLEDKPAFTLDFIRFSSSQKFHDLRRIHLNNSVEDASYCNEQLGSEIFRQAGLPAPRVTHALVSLNGRRLGLYVLKEGFTEDFLSCYFNKLSGNLFEPGEGHDVNQRLKPCLVAGEKHDRAGLEQLAAASFEPNPALRWELLGKVLDRERFITFMALEVMLCHRDGYCLARNNFRVYQERDTDKILFFPHGMDQLFGSADLPWQPQMAGLVARAILETAEGKKLYREQFQYLFTNCFKAERLSARVQEIVSSLRAALTSSEFAVVQAEATLVCERIRERQVNLTVQLARPELKPLEFTNGVAILRDWTKRDEIAGGQMQQATSPDGTPSLHILARTDTQASWRTTAKLQRGRYHFRGRARVSGVQPLSFGVHQGAGLRVGGKDRQSPNLVGDCSWRELKAEFQVDNDVAEVELICELRASGGEVWFDLASLRLFKIP